MQEIRIHPAFPRSCTQRHRRRWQRADLVAHRPTCGLVHLRSVTAYSSREFLSNFIISTSLQLFGSHTKRRHQSNRFESWHCRRRVSFAQRQADRTVPWCRRLSSGGIQRGIGIGCQKAAVRGGQLAAGSGDAAHHRVSVVDTHRFFPSVTMSTGPVRMMMQPSFLPTVWQA